MRSLFALALLPLLGACVSGSGAVIPQPSTPPQITTPPPQTLPPAVSAAPAQSGFIPPQIMQGRGLEGVIGQGEAALQRQFGQPRLNVWEGDARKLQFVGEACVLDIYLYPLRPGARPSATHIEARRASDGRNVDRAACVSALRVR